MFQGVYTAIVTPFTAEGEVDYRSLDALVDFQIENGVDGIVPVGTTGESPTLDTREHIEVIRRVAQRVGGRVQVIAGTGANSTAEALELTEAARDIGVDGTLQVTPYYNRPTDAGIIRHFQLIADIGLPVMLYNVPGRTGRELSIEAIVALAEHPNIVAVKEAAGSVDRVSQILSRLPDMAVFSGDDPLTLPMIAVGAQGVVSVASNAIPDRVTRIVHLALSGDFAGARELHLENHALFQALLSLDVNPLPIKTALAMMGRIQEVFRLPMCRMDEAKRERLEAILQQYRVI
jgi:4-hydroxy-tetrahydrodipicolinate synthase